jgi:ATP-dependent Lon protease
MRRRNCETTELSTGDKAIFSEQEIKVLRKYCCSELRNMAQADHDAIMERFEAKRMFKSKGVTKTRAMTSMDIWPNRTNSCKEEDISSFDEAIDEFLATMQYEQEGKASSETEDKESDYYRGIDIGGALNNAYEWSQGIIIDFIKHINNSLADMSSRKTFRKALQAFIGNESTDLYVLEAKVICALGYLNHDALQDIISSLSDVKNTNIQNKAIFAPILLDYVANIPFGILKPVRNDEKIIQAHLDKSLYGLNDVKSKIVDWLTMQRYSDKNSTAPLLLVGSPGVGKTAFASALADALGVPFFRISFSSAFDRSTLKGHNKTWTSAVPGELARIFYKACCMNPVILFDEIDKAGSSSAGSVVETIGEILDPDYRKFKDDFLGITLDMSSAFIVCTANDIERIPSFIVDRCEKIEVPKYKEDELLAIISDYLPDQIKKAHGLCVNIKLNKDVVSALVKVESIREIKRIITTHLANKLREKKPKRGETVIIDKYDGSCFNSSSDAPNKVPLGFVGR